MDPDQPEPPTHKPKRKPKQRNAANNEPNPARSRKYKVQEPKTGEQIIISTADLVDEVEYSQLNMPTRERTPVDNDLVFINYGDSYQVVDPNFKPPVNVNMNHQYNYGNRNTQFMTMNPVQDVRGFVVVMVIK